MKKYVSAIILLAGTALLLLGNFFRREPVSAEELVESNFKAEGITEYEKIDFADTEQQTGVSLADYICYRFFYENDGLRIEAFLSAPVQLLEKNEAVPCLIYNHGGNRDFGATYPLEITYFAKELYTVCLASNYRGCGKSGGRDEYGGADVDDVIRLLDLCENFNFVDHKAINMLGASRGGMMTYQVLRRDSRIHKAVVVAGLADCFMSFEDRLDMRPVLYDLIGGMPDKLPEEYEKRSATYWAEELNTPLLIFHTTGDWRVSIEQAKALVNKLEAYQKDYEFVSYDSDVHAQLRNEDFEKIKAWLEE